MTKPVLALPSKGRLKEQAEAWLAARGLFLEQTGGARGYSAALRDHPEISVQLLSAREIAEGLISGALHAGITGEDLLYDLAPQPADDFETLARLGFGGADVVVAVPAAWIDVETMADLERAGAAFRKRHHRRLRVATKYLHLTRQFFGAKSVGEYRLVESAGATEAAPATGSADVIVDITSTGATLAANGLKVLSDGLILKSEAVLARSRRTAWTPQQTGALGALFQSA